MIGQTRRLRVALGLLACAPSLTGGCASSPPTSGPLTTIDREAGWSDVAAVDVPFANGMLYVRVPEGLTATILAVEPLGVVGDLDVGPAWVSGDDRPYVYENRMSLPITDDRELRPLPAEVDDTATRWGSWHVIATLTARSEGRHTVSGWLIRYEVDGQEYELRSPTTLAVCTNVPAKDCAPHYRTSSGDPTSER